MTLQRANPTPPELDAIERTVQSYRGQLRWFFKRAMKEFPPDLKVYGRIALEQVHTEGIELTPTEWEEICAGK